MIIKSRLPKRWYEYINLMEVLEIAEKKDNWINK